MDPRGPLIDIAEIIKRNLGQIRKLITNQQRSEDRKRRKSRYPSDSPEALGTITVEERKEKGIPGSKRRR